MLDKIKSFLFAFDLRDALCFGGLACVWYGLHLFNDSLAWVVVGGALFWLSVRGGNGSA